MENLPLKIKKTIALSGASAMEEFIKSLGLEDVVDLKTIQELREFGNRRTGKTTRTVNLAIEKLFEYGSIIIPFQHELQQENNFIRGSRTPLIIDPDWEKSPTVQLELLRRVIKRLHHEAGDFVSICIVNNRISLM